MNRTTAVETWREVCGSDTVMAMMPPTGRMLEEFARRIEAAATADAARYRWLRDPANDVALVLDKVTGELESGHRIYEYRAGEELDAAIDAAMKPAPNASLSGRPRKGD